MAVASFDKGKAGASEMLQSKNPATGEVIGEVPIHSGEQVDVAVATAREAARTWNALGHAERRAHLRAWQREIAGRIDEIAELIHRENGKPRLDALQETFLALQHLNHAIKRAPKALKSKTVSPGVLANYRATISYHPRGVVAVIGPWNYPIFTPMGSIGYALAAGNTVVFKPSELTPLVGKFLGETAAAAIPIPGVLNVVTGDGRTGAALAAADVDLIAFTGSTRTGSKVMATAAAKVTPVLMELGGKDACVVAADADVPKAAEGVVFGALTNAGQTCISVERLYVDEKIHDRFVDAVLAEAGKLRVGAEDAEIGAITSPAQVGIIRDHLEDAVAKGAKVLLGGPAAIQGNFVPPTVLTGVTPEMKIHQDETFGPVIPITKVHSTEEAMRLANDTEYGLGSAIFGREGVRQLADRIVAGMTSINSVLTYSLIPSLPFGGVGQSGFGRIHGDEGLRAFARIKSTAEERFSIPLAVASFNLPKNAYAQFRGAVKQLFGGGVVDRAGEFLDKFRS